MCDYLKRMSPQDTPTDDIRWWSGLAHSVVEYTGPKPFGMDGIVCLWLHERSATQLLDMCDELDAKFSDLKSENARLREELAKARDPQRIGGQADQSSFVYAIEQLREFRWQHATNDEDAIPYINNVAAAHERENAKLRELCADMWHFTGEACKQYPRLFDPAAQGGQMVQPNMIDSFEQRMRELGIESKG